MFRVLEIESWTSTSLDDLLTDLLCTMYVFSGYFK